MAELCKTDFDIQSYSRNIPPSYSRINRVINVKTHVVDVIVPDNNNDNKETVASGMLVTKNK